MFTEPKSSIFSLTVALIAAVPGARSFLGSKPNTESDIDVEQLKAHYDNGGIIVVRDWQLANGVETIVRDTEASKHDEKDLATVFCKCKSGAPYTGVVQGNTSDLESEIDDMVARAKSEQ